MTQERRDRLRRMTPLAALVELGELSLRQRYAGERFGRAFRAGAVVSPSGLVRWSRLRRGRLPGSATRERLRRAWQAAGSDAGFLADTCAFDRMPAPGELARLRAALDRL